MGLDRLAPCAIQLVKTIQKNSCDVLCVLGPRLPYEFEELDKQFDDIRSFDKAFDKVVSCFKSKKYDLPIIYSPVDELTDYNDVRCFQEAAAKSMQRVLKSGFKAPMLLVPESKVFYNVELTTVLAALKELHVPIQQRENLPEKAELISKLSILMVSSKAEDILKDILIYESGRFVARDIGGGDPERMSPPRVEEYVTKLFPTLKVNVISDVETLTKEYPLFAAVNRAANQVKRHQGRIIFLEYKPDKPKKTVLLVGKGVTYDTGGADIKAGGIMAGMSRDKCGAAAVAGFMQVVSERKPKDVHVIAALCMVRNSVGEESYVADEIITSRAGVRVRVGNTDAEGRMCMADPLCYMKERVLAEKLPDPHLYTIATLTGHACISAGEGYSIIVENSVSRKVDHARYLQNMGQQHGEPFEISVLRQDDFDFNIGKNVGEDIVQCNNLASSRTPRGHQVPAAFLIQASGLDKHGLRSDCPMKYVHLDIAASAGEHPKTPTAVPIIALSMTHLLEA